jgi:hypothetical protein
MTAVSRAQLLERWRSGSYRASAPLRGETSRLHGFTKLPQFAIETLRSFPERSVPNIRVYREFGVLGQPGNMLAHAE